MATSSQCKDQTPLTYADWQFGTLVCINSDCKGWGIVILDPDGNDEMPVLMMRRPYVDNPKQAYLGTPYFGGIGGQGPKGWHRLDVERILQSRKEES